MVTIDIKGHGQHSAGAAMIARFSSRTKQQLCTLISDGYGGDGKSGRALYAPSHFRQFAKADLVVMAGDMFASDDERAADRAAADRAREADLIARGAFFAKVGADLVDQEIAARGLPVADSRCPVCGDIVGNPFAHAHDDLDAVCDRCGDAHDASRQCCKVVR